MVRWLYPINRIVRVIINSHFGAAVFSAWSSSLGISAIVHAAGLGALALVVLVHPGKSNDISEINSELSERPSIATVEIEPSLTPVDGTDQSSGGRAGPGGPLTEGVETGRPSEARDPTIRLSETRSESPLTFADTLPPAGELTRSALGIRLGKGMSLGGGLGNGMGDGTGNGSGARFFELETAGTRFVYVLDGSASMGEPHSEARTRLERVKRELYRSIGSMPEKMEFFVIFFNRNSIPMPAEKLQPATLANKEKYLEWCLRVKGGGGTDPREALKLAIALKPDVVYLLTDGVFNNKAVGEVTKANTHGVAIHTFCFGDAAGESLLKDIARQNNGVYKFVP